MAKLCLDYLMLEEFENPAQASLQKKDGWMFKYPFVLYAATAFSVDLKEAVDEIESVFKPSRQFFNPSYGNY